MLPSELIIELVMKNSTENEHLLLHSQCKEWIIEGCNLFIHVFSPLIIEFYLENTSFGCTT